MGFYTQAVQAAITRLKTLYNGNAYNASTNPGGLAQGGHRTNFVPALEDLSDVVAAVGAAAEAIGIAGNQAGAAVADRTIADLIEVYVDHPAGRVYATSYTAGAGWSQVPAPEEWIAYAPLALAGAPALLAAKAAREASA